MKSTQSSQVKELVKEAFALAKNPNNVGDMIHLNDVLEDLKWKMSANKYHVLSCEINTMLNA